MRHIIFILVLICSQLGNAQIDFEKGYFIDNQGNKKECFIKNLDWKNNPISFKYKNSLEDSEVLSKDISEAKEFSIQNTHLYKRFTVSIERSLNTVASLSENRNPKWSIETLFLQAVVIGKANLYAYNDGIVEKFFYESENTPIEQLVRIKYLNDSSVSDNNIYKQQLSNNVKCNSMSSDYFNRIDYNIKSLSKHFDAYNKCNSSDEKNSANYFESQKKKDFFNFRIMPGIYNSTLEVIDGDNYYDASVKINKQVLKLSVEAEFMLPFNKDTWSIFINPTYYKFEPTKSYVSYVNNPGFFNDGDQVNFETSVSYTQFEIPVGFRSYVYTKKSSRVFINAAYIFRLGSSDSKIVIDNKDGLTNAKDVLPIVNANALAFGAGYCYKNFSAEIRYIVGENIINYLDWKAKYQSLGINLGYKLF